MKIFTVSILFSVGSIFFTGCVSSGGSEGEAKALSPVKMEASSDTTLDELKPDIQDMQDGEQVKAAPGFTSMQDTLLASVVKKSKSSRGPKKMKENAESPVYTIQIGAYTRAANALRMQKRAKEQFASQPVYSEYDKVAQIYRVNIGRYRNREDVIALFDSIKQKFPEEYKQCWVNLIQ
jgi:cell division septation protein DedD